MVGRLPFPACLCVSSSPIGNSRLPAKIPGGMAAGRACRLGLVLCRFGGRPLRMNEWIYFIRPLAAEEGTV